MPMTFIFSFSGISLTSPRDLSGDEMEVEESISSKMVEVDDDDDGGVGSDDMLPNGGDTTLMEDDNGYSLTAMEQYSSSMNYEGSTLGGAEYPTMQQGEDEDPDEYEEDFEVQSVIWGHYDSTVPIPALGNVEQLSQ